MAVADANGGCERTSRRDRLVVNRHAGRIERRLQHGELLVGAGEHGDLAARRRFDELGGDEAGDQLGLGVLVAGAADLDRRSIVASRDGVATLARYAQHVHPGGDDLRRAICGSSPGGRSRHRAGGDRRRRAARGQRR